MKNPDRKIVSRLEDLPNIGKTMANYLRLIGIDHPKKLIKKIRSNYICRATGKRHDPCVVDVSISNVHFMEGREPLPWSSFTNERKKKSPS